MRSSLRSRLMLLVICAISFTAVPLILFSRASLLENSMDKERDSFVNTVRLVEDSLSVRYLHLLTSEVESVLQVKSEMRQSAELVRQMLDDGQMGKESQMLARLREVLQAQGLHLAVYTADGAALLEDDLATSVMAEGKEDFKGQSMRSLLQPRTLFTDVEFAMTRASLPGTEGEMPVLVCIASLKDGRRLVLSSSLAEAEKERAALEARMIDGVQERLDELELNKGASFFVISGDGRTLASRGPAFSLGELPEDTRRMLAGGEDVQGETEELLYRLGYFKAMDWYVAAAVPLKAITDPAEAVVRHLLLLAAVMLALSALVMLLLTVRTLAPLRLLTEKASQLSQEDFSSDSGPGFAERMAEGLPVHRQDEVGELAGAFAHMAQALDENIHRLIDTLAVRQRMQGELDAARDIQMGILPPPQGAPVCEGYAASAFLEPAKEVGGDFYDFFTAPDGRQAVVIGDVSDKGVSAALFMSMTVTLVRYALAEGLSCAEAMRSINDRLAANNPSCMFVTLFIGLFDPGTGKLEYASGAHCPPFIVNPDASVPVRALTDTSGPLVGAMDGLGFEPCSAELAPGEYCLLYTDGVSEAMNEQLELFGENRIAACLETLRGAAPGAVISGMMEAVELHRGSAAQSDDITMLCFARS